MPQTTVLTVGSLHYDIMVKADHLPRKDETSVGSRWYPKFGGKGGNQAVAVARAGAVSRMFGAATPEAKPERYRVVVRSNENATTVSVLNAQGQPDASPSAQRIIKVLADDLR